MHVETLVDYCYIAQTKKFEDFQNYTITYKFY